jgi:hypothetical protein
VILPGRRRSDKNSGGRAGGRSIQTEGIGLCGKLTSTRRFWRQL